MKKKNLLLVMLFAILVVCMLGCNRTAGESEDKGKQEITEDKTFHLEELYQKILQLQKDAGLEEPVMLPESSDDFLEMNYPGLKDVPYKQRTVYMAPVTGFATEIFLIEAEDAAGVEKLVTLFETRIEFCSSDTYYAETAQHWRENAKVHTYGNYVCMIVLPGGYIIPENVFEME